MVRNVLIAAALVLSAELALAETVLGDVTWQAKSTSGVVKIDGEGGKAEGLVEVKDGKASGTLTCDLAAFTTGIDLRDKHMKEKYLDVAKYPKATLKLDPVAPSKGQFAWTGALTLKGETKPVHGMASVDGEDLWARFTVSLADYPSIGIPEWLGVTIAKEVVVTVKAKAKK